MKIGEARGFTSGHVRWRRDASILNTGVHIVHHLLFALKLVFAGHTGSGVSLSGFCTAMVRSGKGKTDPKPSNLVALKWEKISRVRARFKRNQPWLKFARTDDDADIVCCTKSLAYNHEVLMVVLQTYGITLLPIKLAEKAVA